MWSDTLLAAERAHLVRLFAWGGGSVVLGVLLLVALYVMRGRGAVDPSAPPSPLLLHFAVQTAAWGAIDLLLAGMAWRGLRLRDGAGAVQLDRMIWLNNGLDIGYVAVGVTLAVTGWVVGRRLGLVGAGVGVIVQGLALLVLDLRFAAFISRSA